MNLTNLINENSIKYIQKLNEFYNINPLFFIDFKIFLQEKNDYQQNYVSSKEPNNTFFKILLKNDTKFKKLHYIMEK